MLKKLLTMICLMPVMLCAQTQPTTQPAGNGFADYSISDPRIQDLQGFTYLHADRKMSIAQMNDQVHPEVLKLEAAMEAKSLLATGPLVMIMHGMTANPQQPIAIQLGFRVNPNSAAPDGYQVTPMP
ncbi:MAG TPA: hypothetical protein VGG19_13260, partial [Tepidisphaeraceae bacterium]